MPHSISRREPGQSGLPVKVGSVIEPGLARGAADVAPMGAWSCDLATEELSWSEGVFDLFGFARNGRIDRREVLSHYGEESRDLLERLRAEAIASCGIFSMDAQIIRADGEERWMRLTGTTRVSNGRPVELYGTKQDITEDRAQWLKRQQPGGGIDTLNSLASRLRFVTEFLDCPTGSSPHAPLGALLLIDLDKYAGINQSLRLGATEGSLGIFAQRLVSAFPDAAMVTLIGHTKFAVLLPKSRSKRALGNRVYNRLSRVLAPVPWRGQMIAIDASAGLAFADHPWTFDSDAMFAAANSALRDAKPGDNDRLRYATIMTGARRTA
jgi:PAS domain S-box-containing protein